jgi:hypothetical protein
MSELNLFEKDDKIEESQKQFIIAFLESFFEPCITVIKEINECKTWNQLLQKVHKYNDGIAEAIGVEAEDEGYNELWRENQELETEVDNLQEIVEQVRPNDSLLDDWKLEIISKHIHKYTPTELEKLFENDKEDEE